MSWKLEELAEQAGVSPRTVRYYVQRGLLPAPAFRGRDTAYTVDHLTRLRAIRRLQEGFLPLDAIQAELDRRTPDEIRALADGTDPRWGAGTVEKTVGRRPVEDHGLPVAVPVRGVVQRVGEADDSRWTRWCVAPGLEIHVAEDADAATRSLAEAWRAEALRVRGIKGGRR